MVRIESVGREDFLIYGDDYELVSATNIKDIVNVLIDHINHLQDKVAKLESMHKL
jgi:UDP-glucose 4-epimerase